jgi:uncharacterized membrane protein HdeD (DUF308 family)
MSRLTSAFSSRFSSGPTTRPPASEAIADWARGVSDTAQGLRTASKWLMIAGILCILGGATAILVPAVASVTFAIFIGWVLIYSSLVMGIELFRGGLPGPKALRIAEAVLTLAAGLYIVIFPLTGTITLTVALAAWFFASGVLLSLEAWRNRGQPGAGIMGFNGVLSVILGVLIAVDLPSSAAWAIGLLVGIHLIVWGVRAVMAAELLRTLTSGRDARTRGMPPTAAPSR